MPDMKNLHERITALADELEAPKLGGQTTWQDAQRDRDQWIATRLRAELDATEDVTPGP